MTTGRASPPPRAGEGDPAQWRWGRPPVPRLTSPPSPSSALRAPDGPPPPCASPGGRRGAALVWRRERRRAARAGRLPPPSRRDAASHLPLWGRNGRGRGATPLWPLCLRCGRCDPLRRRRGPSTASRSPSPLHGEDKRLSSPWNGEVDRRRSRRDGGAALPLPLPPTPPPPPSAGPRRTPPPAGRR
jgi:hypothetical protein